MSPPPAAAHSKLHYGTKVPLTARRLLGQTELPGGAHVAEHGVLVSVQPREAVEVVLALLAEANRDGSFGRVFGVARKGVGGW